MNFEILNKKMEKLEKQKIFINDSGVAICDYTTTNEIEGLKKKAQRKNKFIEFRQEKLIETTIKQIEKEKNDNLDNYLSSYSELKQLIKRFHISMDLEKLESINSNFGDKEYIKNICLKNSNMLFFAKDEFKNDKNFILTLINEGTKVDFTDIGYSLKGDKEFKETLINAFCETEIGKDFDKEKLFSNSSSIYEILKETNYPKLDLEEYIKKENIQNLEI